MTCEKMREQLAEYTVGGLGPWRRFRVERHLATCAACRGEVAALTRAGELVSQVGLESAPAGTWSAIRRRIEQPAPQHAHARPRLRLAVAGALALLLIAVGAIWRPFITEPTPRVQVVSVRYNRDLQTAEESHLSTVYSSPLSDPAAVGMRLDSLEGGS